jgi:hypothetical protein
VLGIELGLLCGSSGHAALLGEERKESERAEREQRCGTAERT